MILRGADYNGFTIWNFRVHLALNFINGIYAVYQKLLETFISRIKHGQQN